MEEGQRSREAAKQHPHARGVPWGLVVLFVVASGSLVFFMKSSSLLASEFRPDTGDESETFLHQGGEDVVSVAVDDSSGASSTTPKGDVTEQKPVQVGGKDPGSSKEQPEKPKEEQQPKDEEVQTTKADDGSSAKTSGEKQTTTTARTAEIPSEEGPKANDGGEEKEEGKKGKKKLNVLMMYPDDWRHDDIGGVGPVVRTPFLNRLASQGIRFTHNCATTSICWISRATQFTGQYVARHKSTHLRYPTFTKAHNWNHTWPYRLQQVGYYVGHVGKWQFWNTEKNLNRLFNQSHFFEGRHWHNMRGKKAHAADMARDSAIHFLRNRPKDKPFAITVAFYPPKAVGISAEPGAQWAPKAQVRATYDNITIPEPYSDMNMTEAYDHIDIRIRKHLKMARARWRGRWKTVEQYQEGMKNYYALIEQVDKACEEIVNELKAQGEYENTVVIFTTDNGLYHGAHGLAGKWYPYDESIRLPLIVYDPRMPREKIGTLDDSFTLNIDLAETFMGAAGLEPDPWMQGRNLADLYLPREELSAERQEPWREEFFYEFPQGTGGGGPKVTALIRKGYKYVYWEHPIRVEELYNLTDDPRELSVMNLTEHKDMLQEMRNRHNELKKQVAQPPANNGVRSIF